MAYMYGGAILLVDLSEGKINKEPTTSYSGDFVGGRGINTKILYFGGQVSPSPYAAPLQLPHPWLHQCH